ncbi:CopD family protein [Sphingobacterium rhinopitheci]|uniref:CopD family protein n=1 Tax=Sphingobacterium rhinopitheci TaxID=2781960 RepID=UPI001F52875F|nr:CopD family protein [Sphingobacterium rhinopitheci]MCI0921236.1 CopD family protein [Sphingobacterium rhinopitheci]
MIYLYAKAVHIIFVICWMAGLFYMPRLFIYHTEAKDKGIEAYTILHQQFVIMENRLWWVITTPAMIITILSALLMLHYNPALLSMGWMQLKLVFVSCMVAYHFKSQQLMYKLRDEKSTWTSGQLRMWNEVSTILLFAIVFLVILKSTLNWIFGVVGLLGLAITLMLLIKVYKKYRQSKGEKVN